MCGGPRINLFEWTEEVPDGSVQEAVSGETQESNDATFIYLKYEPLPIETRASLFSRYLDDNKASHQTRMRLFINNGDALYEYIYFDVQGEVRDFLADPCPFDTTMNSVTFEFDTKAVNNVLKPRLETILQRKGDSFLLPGKMKYSTIEGEVSKEYSICMLHLNYVDVCFKQGSPVVALKQVDQSLNITRTGEVYSLKIEAQKSVLGVYS